MSGIQKVIKYCALALATFLVVSIVAGLMGTFAFLSSIFDQSEVIMESYKSFDMDSNLKKIEIDLRTSQLVIKKGDTLKAETNNKYVSVKQTESTISIKEKKSSFFSKITGEIILYVPEDFLFEKVAIDSGTGKITVEQIRTNILDFDLGTGSVTIDYLDVVQKGQIDSTAGELSILDGNMHNMDLDLGIGKMTLTSKLTGSNEISCGVGETNIYLLGDKEDYQVKVDKGIGSVQLDGQTVSGNTSYGIGINWVDIDGGIGNIHIHFIKNFNGNKDKIVN